MPTLAIAAHIATLARDLVVERALRQVAVGLHMHAQLSATASRCKTCASLQQHASATLSRPVQAHLGGGKLVAGGNAGGGKDADGKLGGGRGAVPGGAGLHRCTLPSRTQACSMMYQQCRLSNEPPGWWRLAGRGWETEQLCGSRDAWRRAAQLTGHRWRGRGLGRQARCRTARALRQLSVHVLLITAD